MYQKAYFEYLEKYYPQYLDNYYQRKTTNNYIIDEFSNLTEEEYKQEIQKKDQINQDFLKQYIDDCMSKTTFPLFNKIEIETISQCNNSCSFCPVSVSNDIRKHKVMTMDIFRKIILELNELNYSGSIGLFSNNEPLLDSMLMDRLQFARKKLPDAYIYIYTNGLLLTPEKLLQILPLVNFIHINNYNCCPELLPSHKKLQQCLIQNRISQNKVGIHLRNKNECLSTRCGNAPNRQECAKLSSPCILPFSQIVIGPDGEVHFCCNDAYGQYTRDNVTRNTLIEIWYGNSFKKSRDAMLKNRNTQFPCLACDMLFMPLAYENINTKVVRN